MCRRSAANEGGFRGVLRRRGGAEACGDSFGVQCVGP